MRSSCFFCVGAEADGEVCNAEDVQAFEKAVVSGRSSRAKGGEKARRKDESVEDEEGGDGDGDGDEEEEQPVKRRVRFSPLFLRYGCLL